MTDEWRKYLRYDIRGAVTKDVGNVVLILKNAPGFAGRLQGGPCPRWHSKPDYDCGFEPPQAGERLADHHLAYVQHVLVLYFGLSVGAQLVTKAIMTVAHTADTQEKTP